MRRIALVFVAVLLVLGSCVSTSLAGAYGRIEGQLLDMMTGEPVVGAMAAVLGTERGALSDSTGSFEITRIVPGTYTLRISHLNYVTLEVIYIDMKADSTFQTLQHLTPRVNDRNETITVFDVPPQSGMFSVVDSRKVIARHAIRDFRIFTKDSLLARVEGIPTMTVDLERAKIHPIPYPFGMTIPNGFITSTCDLRGRGGRITGYLLDEETGAPIIGASILIVGTTCGAMTDPDGFFQILRLGQISCTLRIAHAAYETVEIPEVRTDFGCVTEIQLRMVAKVVDPNEPIVVKGSRGFRGRDIPPCDLSPVRPGAISDSLKASPPGTSDTTDTKP